MPKNKIEEIIFTLITSGLMIYAMGVYNLSLHSNGLKYENFLITLYSFPLEWFIGFIVAFFVASKYAKKKMLELVSENDNPMLRILCLQTFTVCIMVPVMSFLGVVESQGFTNILIESWIQTMLLNFIVAYPIQVFLVGPLSRRIFNLFFVEKKYSSKNVIENLDEIED